MNVISTMQRYCRTLFAHMAPALFSRRFWEREAARDPYQAILTGVESYQEYLDSGRCSLGYLENHLLLMPQWRVLDYGCGNGRLLRWLAPRVLDVTGADVSKTMLKAVRRDLAVQGNIATIHITSVDCAELPDDTYDLLCCMLVLQHMNKERAADLLPALTAKVKPGGYLFLQFPSPDYRRKFPDLYATIDERDPSQPGLARLYTLEEIGRLLAKASIEPLHIELREGDYYVSGRRVTHRDEDQPLPELYTPVFSSIVNPLLTELTIAVNTGFNLDCHLTNNGNVAWRNREEDLVNYVQLGASLIDEEGSCMLRDYARSALPHPVLPGETITRSIFCPPLTTPGAYTVQTDMVNERYFWFSEKGSAPGKTRITVI